MASILVVGQEQRSLERFHRVLSAEGWRVRVAQGRAQALQAAASEPPDLVLAGSEVPGAEELAGAFRRSAGGPGIVLVLPEGGSQAGPAVLGDDRLRLPFADQDLVGAVRRMLASRRETGSQAAPPVRLTSQDIFGDVLAEVEGQLAGRGTVPPAAPAGTVAAPGGLSAPPPSGVAQAAAPGSPPSSLSPSSPPSPPSSRQSTRGDGDIQRKLEQTLSGVLGSDPRRAATPAAAPAATGGTPLTRRQRDDADGAAEIDAMLSKTLSELAARPARGTTLPGTAGGRAAAPAAAPTPAVARPAAGAPAASSAPAGPPAAPAAAMAPPAAAIAPPPRATVPPGPPAPAARPPAAAVTEAPARPPAAPSGAGAPPPLQTSGPGAPPPARAVAAAPALPPVAPATAAAGADAAAARRRFTGQLDLSELDELARTRRKVEPTSRPGVPTGAPPPPPTAGAAAAGSRPGIAAPGSRPGIAPPPGAAPLAAGSRAGVPPPAAAIQAPRTPPAAPPPAPAGGLGESPAATQRIQMVPRGPAEAAGVQFGQYTLLERIAAGGMAEVWKARMRGVEGFQKTVAIKKILPYMTDSADFVGMFIDEAKLAAQLNHPSIVHIYDLGKIGADFYIAMEYVEGKDLRSLLNAGRQHGLPLPLGLALLIAVRLASALDYAHRKRDFEGREIGLVHRDVSPQNVLISFDGDVKLCDFGIAKAVSKAGQTHTGALKGKLQYMSPEQAKGEPVDSRSDIFSLGTVLFEMLTGERLFDGDSEMSVLEAVQQVKVRAPRQVDATIPREVDEIVTRALAGRAEDRFQSAGELGQRLETVLYALKPSPSNTDLAAYLKRVAEKPAPGRAPERPEPSRPSQPAPALKAVAQPAAAPARPVAAPPPAAVPAAAPHAPPPPPYLPTAPAAPPAAATAVAAQLPPPSPVAAAAAGQAAAEVVPLVPLADAPLEEGSRRGRLLLAAAVAALLVIVLATWVLRARRAPAAPAGGPPPAVPHAVALPGSAPPGAPGKTGAAGGAAATPPAGGAPGAAKPAPGGAAKVDVEGLVGQEVARREQALKQKLDEQQKQLQKELEKTKSGKTPPAAATAAAGNAGNGPPPAVPPAGAGEQGRAASRPPASPAAEVRPAAEAPVAPPTAAPPATTAGSAAPESAKARGTEPPSHQPAEGAAAAPAAAGGGPTVPPKLVSSAKPEYPPLARKLRVEGVVVMSVLVDEQGLVEDVRLLEPSQGVGFNEAALQAARGARFRPATRDGVPIKMWARLRIPFKLNQR